MVLWLAVTVVMPVAVGLVTKISTPPAVRSVLLLGLSLANGLLSEALAAGDGYDWRKAITQAVVAFVIAVAAHFGFWRPTGVAAAALAVGSGPQPLSVADERIGGHRGGPRPGPPAAP
jgi:hypothetical protein